MLLDLESLRCFETLAVLLNFRAASRRLAVSPAALSDRIRRLEEQLGEPLFLRSTRKVSLTAAGERLVAHARGMLEANERAFGVVRGRVEAPRVELLVGTRYDLGLSWLVPALQGLEIRAPQRSLHLHFSEGFDLLDRVRQGYLDCAVTSAPLVGGALDYLVLHPERYVLVGSKTLLGGHAVRSPEDVRGLTLLDLSPDLPLFRYFLDSVGGSVPWRFQRTEYLGTIGAVRLRMLQGAGIGVLPGYFVARDLREAVLRRILPRVTLRMDHFRLVWRRDHPKVQDIQRLGADLKRVPLH